ncbi:TetR/AcrR family transcriptional regulator [Guptibacillus algicola]|uniref:TetR/AcrR family transcriptional regulator n=1 Tax=Guptibacillus algicola TaxID=225844 RepID=UPI001CD75F4A|nr:TetR/AcrR family transcriptional regulator [Alkalihalobacillus algicola]MCA0985983.1 TetR/AcrR family transcriptional regulator [Alkalihalobacillus algicola]
MGEQESMEELFSTNENELYGEELTAKQKRIVEAAIQMFSEKGYSSSSTSEIAKRANVAEGTIFRHYKTKKELLLAIVTPVMSNLLAPFIIRDLDKVLSQNYQCYEDFLTAIVKNRQVFIEKHLSIVKILLQEIPFHDELRSQFIDRIGKEVYTRLEAIVIHFQEKGKLVEMPTQSAVRLTATTIGGFLLTRYILLPNNDWNDEEELKTTIHFIMNGMKA